MDRTLNATLSPDVLEEALHTANIMVVLTDPHLEDNPIVWVNDYFCEFTGHARADVIGRNCRFLQGEDRGQPALDRLRQAVARGERVHVLLRNVKADGTPFDNDLFVSPVYASGAAPGAAPRYFIGVQNDATARVTAEREARARETEETAENERERFGMDLHDGLGQELAGAQMLAHVLADRLASEGSAHAPAATRILAVLADALESARGMARGLHPVDASPHGLGDALRALCDAVDGLPGAEGGLGTTVVARVEPVSFEDRRVARHLYRIAQEALSNVVKHARATRVDVTLYQTPGRVHLEVRDDGTGIPPALLEAARAGAEPAPGRADPERRRMGLYGMRYRADLIGAQLVVETPPEGGTVVRCILPMAAGDGGKRAGHRERSGERE